MTAAPARLPLEGWEGATRLPDRMQGPRRPVLCSALPHKACPLPPAPSPSPASQLVAGGREAQNNPAREGQPVAPQSPASRS